MEEHTPSKSKSTVFVGGISWKADEEGLRKYFEEFGTVVECKIIFDRATNKSKGYGFLTFGTEEEAQRVKEAKDLIFLGKTMNVGEAYHKNRSDGGTSPAMVSPLHMPIDVRYGMEFAGGQAAYPAYYYDQYSGQYQPYVPYVGIGYYPGMVSPVGGVAYYDPGTIAHMQSMAPVPYYSPDRAHHSPEQAFDQNGRPMMNVVPTITLPPTHAQVAVGDALPPGRRASANALQTSSGDRDNHRLGDDSVDSLVGNMQTHSLSSKTKVNGSSTAREAPKPTSESRHLRSSSEGSGALRTGHVGGRPVVPEEAGSGSRGCDESNRADGSSQARGTMASGK